MKTINKNELNKALAEIRNNTFKSNNGTTVVPYDVVKKTFLGLINDKFNERNKKIEHPEQLNLIHKHQIVNGCKVTVSDDRAEIIDMLTCDRTVIYKNKYKTLGGFKRAIIRKTLKIWMDNY